MGNLKKQTFPVLNMHCAGCANNVEKTVRKLVGITDASVNFASNTLSVSYETDKLTSGEIRAAVLAAGYDLIIEEEHAEERQEEEQQKRYRRLKVRVIGAWIFCCSLIVAFYGFYACALFQRDTDGAGYPCTGVVRYAVLYWCLETSTSGTQQYGYAGCTKYIYCLPVQRL